MLIVQFRSVDATTFSIDEKLWAPMPTLSIYCYHRQNSDWLSDPEFTTNSEGPTGSTSSSPFTLRKS